VVERVAGERELRVLLAVLALIGLLISAYLTWVHLSGTAPVCIGGGGGCEAVQSSRYSKVMGIPVAVLGLLAYAVLLGTALVRDEKAALLGLFIALVGTLYSAYLTYLELFVIQAICQWCVASAIICTIVLILTALRVSQTVNLQNNESGR
jgi:uncharacterized membrane protein